jgi:tetratricopeptide (TPR) repeat protein
VSSPARHFFAVAMVVSACAAAPHRPHPDREAMREAQRVAPPEGSVSARAIAYYLEARRLLREGNALVAAERLRLAVAHDDACAELRAALAEALAMAGQVEPAEAEARRAIELDRTGRSAADGWVLIGRIRTVQRRAEEAVLAFRRAIQVETALAEKGEPPQAAPWRLLAELYLESGDEPAARRVLDDGAEKLKGDGSAFREIGRTLLDRHQPAAAERYLRRAIEIDRGDEDGLRLLARAHEALGRAPEARDDLVALLRLDPDDEDALVALGRLSLASDDADAARELFGRAVHAARDSLGMRLQVAYQWMEAHRPAEALRVARDGLAESGPDPRLRLAEGLALQDLRRWAESATALAQLRPQDGDVYLSARVALAYTLSRAGRHAEAARALEGPLAARPGEVRLVTMRAFVLERAGRGDDAVALLRKALASRERTAASDEIAELAEALAESLGRRGKTAEAVELLRVELASRPRDETLLYALGAAYDRAGQSEAALAQMKALLALDPDHADALNFVGYSLAEQGVRLEEAERLVRRALQLKPRSGYILDSLGWVHYRKGEYARAAEVLERADALVGPEPTILEHLGDTYRALARNADAVSAYRRAIRSLADESPAEQLRIRASLERKLKEMGAREGKPAVTRRER